MSSELRIGDAEREQAAAVLADHYTAGRLDHEEYGERLDAIWTARTRADLDVLFHDLPRPVQPAPPVQRGGRGGRLPFPVVALFILVVGAVVITHLPVVLLVIAGVLILKMSRHHRRGPRAWNGRVGR